jgi:hypothetical protein
MSSVTPNSHGLHKYVLWYCCYNSWPDGINIDGFNIHILYDWECKSTVLNATSSHHLDIWAKSYDHFSGSYRGCWWLRENQEDSSHSPLRWSSIYFHLYLCSQPTRRDIPSINTIYNSSFKGSSYIDLLRQLSMALLWEIHRITSWC